MVLWCFIKHKEWGKEYLFLFKKYNFRGMGYLLSSHLTVFNYWNLSWKLFKYMLEIRECWCTYKQIFLPLYLSLFQLTCRVNLTIYIIKELLGITLQWNVYLYEITIWFKDCFSVLPQHWGVQWRYFWEELRSQRSVASTGTGSVTELCKGQQPCPPLFYSPLLHTLYVCVSTH